MAVCLPKHDFVSRNHRAGRRERSVKAVEFVLSTEESLSAASLEKNLTSPDKRAVSTLRSQPIVKYRTECSADGSMQLYRVALTGEGFVLAQEQPFIKAKIEVLPEFDDY